MLALIETSVLRNSWELFEFLAQHRTIVSIISLLTWYEAVLFLQVRVEYFQCVLVKTEINYSALCNDEYRSSLPT